MGQPVEARLGGVVGRLARWALSLALWAAVGCVSMSFPKTPAQGGPAWHELTTQHFAIVTNLTLEEGTRLANELENARAVITKVAYGRDPPPQAKGRVLALRGDEYANYFDPGQAGVFIPHGWLEPVMVTNAGMGWSSNKETTARHELAHYLSHLYVDLQFQPRWFSEGVAEYLETYTHNMKTGEARVGRAPQNARYADAKSLANYDQLWSFSGKHSHYLYATSWVVIHYLINNRPAEFAKFERALASEQDAKQAWEQIFPDLRGAEFDKTMRDYLFTFNFAEKKANVAPVVASVESRSLSEADVLGLRGTLYYLSFGNRTRDEAHQAVIRDERENERLAQQSLDRALREDPDCLFAHLARWRYGTVLPESAAAARKALAKDEKYWLAWFWYYLVLAKSGAPASERSEALANASRLAPNARLVEHARMSDAEAALP
jgi:hypothetical protein